MRKSGVASSGARPPRTDSAPVRVGNAPAPARNRSPRLDTSIAQASCRTDGSHSSPRIGQAPTIEQYEDVAADASIHCAQSQESACRALGVGDESPTGSPSNLPPISIVARTASVIRRLQPADAVAGQSPTALAAVIPASDIVRMPLPKRVRHAIQTRTTSRWQIASQCCRRSTPCMRFRRMDMPSRNGIYTSN